MSNRSGFPPLTAHLVDGSRQITMAWFSFLRDLYQYSGLAGANFKLWEDLVVPCASMTADAGSPPGFDTLKGSTRAYSFDAGSEEVLHFAVQIPHGYTPETDIRPFVQWAPSTTNTGKVRWAIEYTWQSVDGDFGSSTTITTEDAGSGTAHKHQAATFSNDVAGLNKGVSSVIVARIYRDATHANDTYSDDAFLLSAGFHYQRSGHGTPGVWS